MNSQLSTSHLTIQKQAEYIAELEESGQNQLVEHDRLRRVVRTNSSLADDLMAAKQRVKELELGSERLKNRLREAEEERVQLESSVHTQAELHRDEKQLLERKIVDLEKQLSTSLHTIDELRRDIETKTTEHEQINKDLERLTAALSGK